MVGSLVGERDERPLVVAGWQADAGQVEGSFGVWVEAVDDGDALAFEGSCDIGNRGVVGNTSGTSYFEGDLFDVVEEIFVVGEDKGLVAGLC